MSVTFCVAAAKLSNSSHTCSECGGKGGECNWCIDGQIEELVSDCAELNVANTNAAAILNLIDPSADYVTGEWAASRIPGIIKTVMGILNSDKKDALVVETVVDRNVTYIGRDADYVQHRLTALLAVLRDANNRNSPVVWG